MTTHCHTVGAWVWGAPTAPRGLCEHDRLLTAYADGRIADGGDTREAYLSHFTFGKEMQDHYAAHRQSVAEYAGPCCCRWLVLDIDRPDLTDALTDARKLVAAIGQRYPELEGDVPVYFSGGKGFHIMIELAHRPPPAVGFQGVARAFALALAEWVGVTIDPSIYDIAHIIRLPNTRHPRTGLYKRRIDYETFLTLALDGIVETARHPAGDGLPGPCRLPPQQMAQDWALAERESAAVTEARAAIRRDAQADTRAPRYLMDLMRFGVGEGERHTTLFRCAAWLTEQGAPPSLVSALLTEPGCDVGLSPADVTRQIRCGVEHAGRQAARETA